eukprot:m.24070 g.24070  ORF g.24070 m.24070 type:complete len:331 (-) comp8611_c1_seq1:143-1135(-)
MFEPGIDERLLALVLPHSPSRELAERALAETENKSLEAALSWLKSSGEADNALKPTSEKTQLAGSCAHNRIDYASASMQGWRAHMEDVVSVQETIPQLKNTSFFAVFDGHGGDSIARECAAQLLPTILSHISSPEPSPEKLRDAMKKGFTELDAKLAAVHVGDDGPGSTALAVFVTPTHILCGNLGDTRCVLVVGGEVVQLSRDHKPDVDTESKRIKKAGGQVTVKRVNGQLAVSRAFGDYSFKRTAKLSAAKQMVTAEPDVEIRPRGGHAGLLVLATDGVWDVLPNAAMAEAAAAAAAGPVASVCADLVDRALAAGSRDNISAILVRFS